MRCGRCQLGYESLLVDHVMLMSSSNTMQHVIWLEMYYVVCKMHVQKPWPSHPPEYNFVEPLESSCLLLWFIPHSFSSNCGIHTDMQSVWLQISGTLSKLLPACFICCLCFTQWLFRILAGTYSNVTWVMSWQVILLSLSLVFTLIFNLAASESFNKLYPLYPFEHGFFNDSNLFFNFLA